MATPTSAEASTGASFEAAGFAIENAKLFDDEQLRTLWLEAGRKIAVRMMGSDSDDAGTGPGLVAQTALEASESALVLITSAPNESGQEVLAGAGTGAQESMGQLLDLERRRAEMTGRHFHP